MGEGILEEAKRILRRILILDTRNSEARELLGSRPGKKQEDAWRTYGHIVVDEAQDLSLAMVRLLHGLVGENADAFTLIGDGQHTSWFHGAKVIGPRCNAVIAGIKIVVLVANKITGGIKHCLKWVHNWHRPRYIFVIVEIMIICRETPIRN